VLGRRIRKLRRAQGMSLSGLADVIGVTPSAVSQIERDMVDPSLRTLRAIASALETPLSLIFADTPSQDIVVRKDERIPFPPKGGRAGHYELVSPGGDRDLEMVLVSMDPGERSADVPLPHDGDECLLVLQGKAEVTVAGSSYLLSEGDSIYIEKGLPHVLANVGDTALKCIACFTPYSF